MTFEIGEPIAEQVEILISIFCGKGFARHNFGTTTMHLERPYGCDHHYDMWDESAVTAFDVEEFFHADIRAEAGFCDHVVSKLQSDLIRDDGGLSMCNIGKGTCMYECCVAFQSLHEIGFDGVLHQHSHSACNAQVFHGHGLAASIGSDHHVPKTIAHIFERRGECQYSHDLRSNCYVVA